jgi:octopine/nopaline transport system permease protein
LVSITGVAELLRQAQVGAGSTGLPFDFYLIAGLIYLAISTVSGGLMRLAERHFNRGVRRA